MHLFYPSHDIALAHGVKHFNPPIAALRLQEDLAYLYEIWNQPFLNGKNPIPIPWGWDLDTRDFIHKEYGIKMTQLPTNQELEMIRQLSSRRSTIHLMEELWDKVEGWNSKEQNILSRKMPQYLDSEDRLWQFITRHDADGKAFVLKTPWSSSGRGLHVSKTKTQEGLIVDNSRTIMMQQAKGTIRRMGGIMGEEWIENKIQDFAMLFYASDQEVRFIGYSLFDNDDSSVGTTYRQGYLTSNENIIQKLEIPQETLDKIAKAYEEILTAMLRPLLVKPWHLGYLGIDMMTYREDAEGPDDRLRLHPCIEMNLRCTMGVVCRLWHDRHKTEGVFKITPMLQNGHFKAEFLQTERMFFAKKD